jgi:branched-chain amino acid transport system substrate-binding protein
MVSRRRFLQSTAAAAAALTSGVWPARAANAPGVTDTEIKFGQTMPYSGPASAYGVIGRTETAYFKMINEMGGINGRKLNFVSLDDGYSPPKTVEQTRRLVEQEQVAFIFGTLGGVTNIAVRQYLNDLQIPQLFGAAAADQLGDPQHHPWTIGLKVVYTPNPTRFVRQHRFDCGPFVVAQFVAHDSELRFWNLNHVWGSATNPQWSVANALNLLPLPAA